MKYFNSNQTLPFKFIDGIASLSDKQIEDIIQKAKQLGMSQDQINQGLKLINQIKKENN